MSLFAIKRAYTQKPPVGVGINWNHPLSQGLIHAVPMNGTNMDYAMGKMGVRGGNQQYVKDHGTIVSLHDGSGDKIQLQNNFDTVENALSIFAIASANTVGTNNDRAHIFGLTDTLGVADAAFMAQGLTTHDMRVVLNANISTSVTIAAPGTLSTGVPYAFGFSWDGADMYGYLDGVLNESTPNAGPIQNLDSDIASIIGVYPSDEPSTLFSWDGEIICVFVWDRYLTAAEQRSLYENPWQMFEPRTIYVGAGTIVTITDVANSGETPGAGSETWDDGSTGNVITGTGFV